MVRFFWMIMLEPSMMDSIPNIDGKMAMMNPFPVDVLNPMAK